MSLTMRLVYVLSRSSTSRLLRPIRTIGNSFGEAVLLVLQGTHSHYYHGQYYSVTPSHPFHHSYSFYQQQNSGGTWPLPHY